MRSKLTIVMLAACALLTSGAARLAAQRPLRSVVPEPEQPLMAIALQNLTFGPVLPGILSTVTTTDPHRAGLFEIRGPASAAVRLEFVLPSFLEHVGGGGATLPVVFGSGNASAGFGRGLADLVVLFNPHGPFTGPLSPIGRLFVRIGGTAAPGLPQQGGEYRATIYLTVYDLGSE